MVFDIPGQTKLEIRTIILDLNGTLSVGGTVPEGVKPRLNKLKQLDYSLLFFTGNTRGDAQQLADELGIDWKLAKNAAAKRELAQTLNPDTCASIGNGLIDRELMSIVKLRIVTLQAEGVHVQTMLQSDIIIPTICDALDLFIDPSRLIATLRS
jgi:soluble P-type ATPase